MSSRDTSGSRRRSCRGRRWPPAHRRAGAAPTSSRGWPHGCKRWPSRRPGTPRRSPALRPGSPSSAVTPIEQLWPGARPADRLVQLGELGEVAIDLGNGAADAAVELAPQALHLGPGRRDPAGQILRRTDEAWASALWSGPAASASAAVATRLIRLPSPRSASPGAPNSRSWIWSCTRIEDLAAAQRAPAARAGGRSAARRPCAWWRAPAPRRRARR